MSLLVYQPSSVIHTPLGSGSGSNLNRATADRSIAIGYKNFASANGASIFGSNITNAIDTSTMIGPSNTAKLTILGATGFEGFVDIGTTSPWATLSASGTVAFAGLGSLGSTDDALCINSSGQVLVNTGGTDCTVSSERFKHDIVDLTVGLDKLLELRPISYKQNDTDEERLGLIVEEVLAVEPRLVFFEDDGSPRGVRYTEIVPWIIQAIQELYTYVFSADQPLQPSARQPLDGVLLRDQETGGIYCLSIHGGETITRAGECTNNNESNLESVTSTDTTTETDDARTDEDARGDSEDTTDTENESSEDMPVDTEENEEDSTVETDDVLGTETEIEEQPNNTDTPNTDSTEAVLDPVDVDEDV